MSDTLGEYAVYCSCLLYDYHSCPLTRNFQNCISFKTYFYFALRSLSPHTLTLYKLCPLSTKLHHNYHRKKNQPAHSPSNPQSREWASRRNWLESLLWYGCL